MAFRETIEITTGDKDSVIAGTKKFLRENTDKEVKSFRENQDNPYITAGGVEVVLEAGEGDTIYVNLNSGPTELMRDLANELREGYRSRQSDRSTSREDIRDEAEELLNEVEADEDDNYVAVQVGERLYPALDYVAESVQQAGMGTVSESFQTLDQAIDWIEDEENIELSQRMIDRFTGGSQDRGRERDPSQGMPNPGGDVSAHDDGSIRFTPEFTKKEANYREVGDRKFDSNHSRCEDCAHFIEGGGCHVVQGPINKDEYCENFYSDFGAYANAEGGEIDVNLWLWGERFNWTEGQAEKFLLSLAQKLEQRTI